VKVSVVLASATVSSQTLAAVLKLESSISAALAFSPNGTVR
jgi:hypothetical protein